MVRRVVDKKGLRDKGIKTSNVHLLRLEGENKFPRRFRLTENRVVWLEDEIDAWIEQRAAARDDVEPEAASTAPSAPLSSEASAIDRAVQSDGSPTKTRHAKAMAPPQHRNVTEVPA